MLELLDTTKYTRKTLVVNYDFAEGSLIARIEKRGGRFERAECVRTGFPEWQCNKARIVYWIPR